MALVYVYSTAANCGMQDKYSLTFALLPCALLTLMAAGNLRSVELPAVAHDAQRDALQVTDGPPARVVGTQRYRWSPAVMGGLEYATGLVWPTRHPEVLLLRADGGGIWRLNRQGGGSWVNLSDGIGWNHGQFVTADSVAVDPDQPDSIYVSGGGGRWGEHHDLLRTTDGGRNWQRCGLVNAAGKAVMMDGNGPDKQGGERLIVDANDPRVLWFASRRDGLFISRDRALTWAGVSSLSERGGGDCGLTFVVVDPASGSAGTAAKRVFVGVHAADGGTGSMWTSADGGTTWQRLGQAGNDAEPNGSPLRARVGPDGTLYTTWAGGNGGIWRWKNGWQDLTPADARGQPFCGINLHPTDPRRLIAAGTYDAVGIFSSTDGGTTWTNYRYQKGNLADGGIFITDPVPYERGPDMKYGGNASDVAFDQVDPSIIWHTSFSGPHRFTGLGSAQLRGRLIGDGREQMTCARVVSPAAGAPLISGIWDLGGFRHEHFDRIPEHIIHYRDANGRQVGWQDIFSLDNQPADPDRIVLAGGWQWNMTGDAAWSEDNGRTFSAFPSKPFADAKFGRIAQGVDRRNVLWAPMGDDVPLYATIDNGATWQVAAGAPVGMVKGDGPWTFYTMIAADRVRKGAFTCYDRRDGRTYRSLDGGLTWKHVGRLPSQGGNHWDHHTLLANPVTADDLWLDLYDQGLFHSSDGGATWQRIPGIEWVVNIGFGKGQPGKPPTLFLFGQIGGTPTRDRLQSNVRMHRSEDLGRTWTTISDERMGFGQIAPGMTGCFQKPGRVYVTTSARGIWVGVPE